MTDRTEAEREPAERVNDIHRIVEEVQLAVREALLKHKRDGNPVAIWKDGRVQWIPPEDI